MQDLLSLFMNEPRHMVMTYLFISIIYIILLGVYYFVYPKKKPHYLFLLISISLLSCLAIFRHGTYDTGDLSVHTSFAMFFYEELRSGVVIPQWSGNFFLNYGGPLFFFQYPLPYYMTAFIHQLSFNFLESTKILLTLSFVGSGLTMFYFIKSEFDEKRAFISSLFYLYAPYHLIDLNFRVSLGEIISFVFIPLIFLFTKRLLIKQNRKSFVALSLSVAFLILSHVATAAVSLILLFFYVLIQDRKILSKKSLMTLSLSIALGIGITAFFLLPILFESRYVVYGLLKEVTDFKPLMGYLFSSFMYGFLFQGSDGNFAFILGYAQLVIILLSIYLIVQGKFQKYSKYLITFSLLGICILFFLMQRVAEPLWNLPILNGFQFPWRLLTEISFLIAILTACVTSKMRSTIVYVLLAFFVIISTLLNWGNRKMLLKDDQAIYEHAIDFPDYTKKGYSDPNFTIWTDPKSSWIGVPPKAPIEIIIGRAKIVTLEHTSTYHEYILQAATPITIRENTLYFPGWEMEVNNKPYPFSYTEKPYAGILTAQFDPGLYDIQLKFRDTPLRFYAKLLSLFSFGCLFFVCFFTFRNRSYR